MVSQSLPFRFPYGVITLFHHRNFIRKWNQLQWLDTGFEKLQPRQNRLWTSTWQLREEGRKWDGGGGTSCPQSPVPWATIAVPIVAKRRPSPGSSVVKSIRGWTTEIHTAIWQWWYSCVIPCSESSSVMPIEANLSLHLLSSQCPQWGWFNNSNHCR